MMTTGTHCRFCGDTKMHGDKPCQHCQPAPAPLPEEVKNINPCPFCCSKRVRAVVADFKYAGGMTYRIKCDGCGAYGPGISFLDPKTADARREQARTLWNSSVFSTLTRRLAEVEARLEFYQGLAKERHDREVACIARAEAADARVGELEWLVEVQRVYALGIIDMGSESEYRACALDELSLSYADALKCAGMWDETRQSGVGFFAFNWSALAAVEG